MDQWNVDTLKEHFERILEEKEKRLLQSSECVKTALSNALIAQEKAVAAAFMSSEKAIEKAEIAQQLYNVRSNEFRAALDDQAHMLLPRQEADVKFQQVKDLADAQQKQIIELQRIQSSFEGGSKAGEKTNTQHWAFAGLAISIALNVLGAIGSLIFYLITKH